MNRFSGRKFDLDLDEALGGAKAALVVLEPTLDAAPIPGLSTATNIVFKVIERVEVRLRFIGSILGMIL